MKSRDLIAALRAVNEGMVLLSPQVIDSLIKPDEDPVDEESLRRNQQLFDSFSKREKNVLRLIANGYSNQRIAQELFLAEATVRNYISSIYTKLGTNNRLEVIEYAKKFLFFLFRRRKGRLSNLFAQLLWLQLACASSAALFTGLSAGLSATRPRQAQLINLPC